MNSKKLIVHSQNHLRFIAHDDIIVCKSDNSYTSIYLTNGEELVMCKSLTQLLKELDPLYFIRVSQSYLININFIKAIDKKKKQIELINNQHIPFTTTLKRLLRLLA
jgi:DNA-binding LytR/AlgR family response regulator